MNIRFNKAMIALSLCLLATLAVGLAVSIGGTDIVHQALALPHGDIALGMTTLAANKMRTYQEGDKNELPVIASDIIYQGAAIGIQKSTGLTRPLVAGDRFCGFCEAKADNASGSASAINSNMKKRGRIQLPITALAITDNGLPVYASDDDTFSLSPVGGSFVGFVDRYVSSGVGVIEFDALNFQDPYAGFTHELKSANYTIDAEDAGKFIWVDTDAVVITLPAVEGIAAVRVGNLGAYGAVGVSVSPAAADMIEGPDITAADNKKIINTKATANRGDYIELGYGDANGWSITRKVGTWVREA